jgi:hypothetical protein
MTFQIVGQSKILPDLCCPLPMNIQSEIDEEGLPVPRTRNYYTTWCNVQCTDIFSMTKKTEIWIILWIVKVKNVDHSILTSRYSVAFESSMIGSMKDFTPISHTFPSR